MMIYVYSFTYSYIQMNNISTGMQFLQGVKQKVIECDRHKSM